MPANNLGDSYMKVDRLDEAATLILRALAIQERLDGKASMAIYCFNLARIYYARKQKGKVRNFSARTAVDLYRAVGDQMVQLIERGLVRMDNSTAQETQLELDTETSQQP